MHFRNFANGFSIFGNAKSIFVNEFTFKKNEKSIFGNAKSILEVNFYKN
jgi:hypothetical protein